MSEDTFAARVRALLQQHEQLIARPNQVDATWDNGLFQRYLHPILTAAHTPIFWRYDLDAQTNPYLMERLGVNAVFNAGAIELHGTICLVCRVEGAESEIVLRGGGKPQWH